MQKSNLRSQLLKNYILLFILISLIGFFSTFLIITIGGFIQSNSIENTFRAEDFMKDNIKAIETEALIEYGGGIEVIHKSKEVLLSKGKNTTDKDTFSEEEFSEYLFSMQKPDDPYKYDIAYNGKEKFWLIINYPIDFEVRLYVNKNNQVNSDQNARISLFILSSFVIYFLMFFLGLMVYSNITAKTFIRPLNQLISSFNKVIKGERYYPIEMEANEEFVELNKIFDEMINKIEKEKLLKQASEENRKKLVLDISHDLKNPLASIIGYSELIMSKDISKEDLEKYSKIINRNAKRSNELITDLFDYSKLNSEDYSMSLEKVDFTEFIRRYIIDYIDIIESQSFEYDFIIPEHSIEVAIDEKLLMRALNNVLNNALKYNAVGTKITLKVIDAQETVSLMIKDNGLGISKELQDNIFEPFASSMKSETSSGLGLAIVKKIIEKHDGKIIYHKDEDFGTRFTITLNKLS